MKPSILRNLILVAVLLPATAAMADTYFSMGDADTLRINSARLGKSFQTRVRARLENRYDRWNLNVTYPEGLQALNATRGTDLTVGYLDSQGAQQYVDATLTYNNTYTTFMSNTGSATGYCDYFGNGSLVSYGSVKWEPGDYDDMFTITFFVNPGFEGGDITINGNLSAQPDPRDSAFGLALTFFRRISVMVVDIQPGDVNADGQVNITDATILIGYLINGSGEIDYDAADLTGDGQVNISDATMLINHLSTQP